MPILELSPRERSQLLAAAHALRPVVLIGEAGLSAAVLKEIDLALASHGLIKVRAGGEEREAREEMLSALCAALSCAAVRHLGKTFVLFRPQPEDGRRAGLQNSNPLKRRASEPYTPKKRAAEGKTGAKKRAPRASAEAGVRAGLNKAGQAARPSTRKTAAASPGIARRGGSALSLRAGARSGVRRAVRSIKK